MPDAWREHVWRWAEHNEALRPRVEGEPVLGRNEEYLFYQTLVGAWPLEPYSADDYAEFVERIQAYMAKALREAKVHTSWINPNTPYDEAARQFIAAVLDEEKGAAFLADFRPFQRSVSSFGLLNSLSQTLLKITSPGVPDTYQGTELWDFSLVDPDNRRPVDYDHRRSLLDALRASAGEVGAGRLELARELVKTRQDGRIKLYVTSEALRLRRENLDLWTTGDYLPLETTGSAADRIVAFARRNSDSWAIVAVPRLALQLSPDGSAWPLGKDWGDTRILPPASELLKSDSSFVDIFTGRRFELRSNDQGWSAAELFADFPLVLAVNRR
jgi:(1->4)-alpha-D-glucan 1-alpha-D-glucosylmutase